MNALFVVTSHAARPRELSPCPGHSHHWYANGESYFLVGEALGLGMKKLLDRQPKPRAETVEPKPRPVAKPSAAKPTKDGLAKFGGMLRARITEELDKGRKLTFYDARMRTRLKIVSLSADGVLSTGGLRIPISKAARWESLTLKDLKSLSLAVLCVGNKQDHAIAAFYHMASGQPAEGRMYLRAAGKDAGVLEAFDK